MGQSEQLAWIIRRQAIDMVHSAKASHIGGILSVADVMAVLFRDVLRYDSTNPKWEERDRLILSKGHNGVALYIALAESGFFDKDILDTYGKDGSSFSCHVSHKGVPGVEISTGSLGHGVCVACGMALAAKMKKQSHKVYAIVGDGECNEGSFWETVMFAGQKKLDNFIVIVDRNQMQAMGKCESIIDLGDIGYKVSGFGWKHIEVVDGHNHDKLREAFGIDAEGRPRIIVVNTIKGKGVSFMENELLWHYRDPQGEFYEQAVKEIEESKKQIFGEN